MYQREQDSNLQLIYMGVFVLWGVAVLVGDAVFRAETVFPDDGGANHVPAVTRTGTMARVLRRLQ